MSTSLKTAPSSFLDIPGCQFGTTFLEIHIKLAFNHWERIGEVLKRAESGVQWWLGDWMAYGEKRYGEKYAQALDVHEKTGTNIDTLRNYQYVAERVEVVRRRTTLAWSHHHSVSSLSAPEQDHWLAKAEVERWSVMELRREVRRAEAVKNFRLVNAMLDKILERITDGCYTVDAIRSCTECNRDIFPDLSDEEIKAYMQLLVTNKRAEWRDQGGQTDVARGEPTRLCVPSGMPFGSDFKSYRPVIEYDDDEESVF